MSGESASVVGTIAGTSFIYATSGVEEVRSSTVVRVDADTSIVYDPSVGNKSLVAVHNG